MTVVLEKVRQLENYLEWRGGYADSVMDLTLDKMLQRERAQMEAQLARLRQQLAVFEGQYGRSTPDFYERFERGELGDDADYFEWSATWEMVQQLQQGLRLLS
jgi:hypothetical protein